MPTYLMGEVIRSFRIRSGYTQEELSFGICTPATISRIENGVEFPSQRTFQAIIQRLNQDNYLHVDCISEQDMRRFALSREILKSLQQKNTREAEEKIREYKGQTDKGNKFGMQFYLYTDAVLKARKTVSPDQVIIQLKQALKQTIPETRWNYIKNKRKILFTHDELLILNNLALQLRAAGKRRKAAELFEDLIRYFEQQNPRGSGSVKIYPLILHNTAMLMAEEGQIAKAVKLCDTGISICAENDRITVLPYLLCMKARCLTDLRSEKESRDCFKQAKTILDITKDYKGYGCFKEFYEAREPVYVTL